MICVGIERKNGNFEDNGRRYDYDNLMLYCVDKDDNEYPRNGSTLIGKKVYQVKARYNTTKIYGVDSWRDLVNREITLSYIPKGKYAEIDAIYVVLE